MSNLKIGDRVIIVKGYKNSSPSNSLVELLINYNGVITKFTKDGRYAQLALNSSSSSLLSQGFAITIPVDRLVPYTDLSKAIFT